MYEITTSAEDFIRYCKLRRKLSPHTLRAYACDLKLFSQYLRARDSPITMCNLVTKQVLEDYLDLLCQECSVKTVKRKIACIHSFFNYLEYQELIERNPFDKFKLQIKEGYRLPNSMTLGEIDRILKAAYGQDTRGPGEDFIRIRDIAILELLFAGGLRVSELCHLTLEDLDIRQGTLHIIGKGNKERVIYLENKQVITALKNYLLLRNTLSAAPPFLFTTKFRQGMSTQGVRNLVFKYAKLAGISKRITPHAFRHSFASLLLEEGVDIKFIQDFLGHSSITTTQIYLHTSEGKKREIMSKLHPRQKISTAESGRLSEETE